MRLQVCVELVEDDARFDPRPALGDVHLENAIEVLGGVELKSRADRLPGLRRAAAPRRDRDAVARGDLDGAYDILARPRDDDPERLDLVDARVGGVERPRDRVEADLARDVLFKAAAEGVVGHKLSADYAD